MAGIRGIGGDRGVRAVFSFPLSVGAVRPGALNLYSDRPGRLTDHQHADALVMAEVAAEAVLAMQAGGWPRCWGSRARGGLQLPVCRGPGGGVASGSPSSVWSRRWSASAATPSPTSVSSPTWLPTSSPGDPLRRRGSGEGGSVLRCIRASTLGARTGGRNNPERALLARTAGGAGRQPRRGLRRGGAPHPPGRPLRRRHRRGRGRPDARVPGRRAPADPVLQRGHARPSSPSDPGGRGPRWTAIAPVSRSRPEARRGGRPLAPPGPQGGRGGVPIGARRCRCGSGAGPSAP